MGTDINLVKGLLSCLELNGIFLLELQPPGKGLPEGTSLNHYSPTVPTTVPSNLTHTNSLLHHTSAEDIPQHESSRTPSNNILVTDHFFNDTDTRELSYVPSKSSTAFT